MIEVYMLRTLQFIATTQPDFANQIANTYKAVESEKAGIYFVKKNEDNI